MGEEKRQNFRINIKLCADCKGKNFFQNATTDNISTGGVFLATDRIEPVGSLLEIVFDFEEDDRKISVIAEVVWVRSVAQGALPPGMGVKFIKVYPANGVEYLNRIINGSGRGPDIDRSK